LAAGTAPATRAAAPTRRRGRGRPVGENDFDSRDALLRASHELLLRSRGLPVPLSAICELAGVDVAMVRYHFEDRRGLMTALFERLCAAWAHDLENLLALDVSPRRKLEIHIAQIIRNYRRRPYTNRLMTELIASSKPALAKQLSRDFVRPLIDFHRRLIAQGVASGDLRPVEPMYFFCSVIGMCEFQFAVQPLLGVAFRTVPDDKTVESAFIDHTIALLLDGVAAPRPGHRIRQISEG
jgi:AcrR family transcriptional regulator